MRGCNAVMMWWEDAMRWWCDDGMQCGDDVMRGWDALPRCACVRIFASLFYYVIDGDDVMWGWDALPRCACVRVFVLCNRRWCDHEMRCLTTVMWLRNATWVRAFQWMHPRLPWHRECTCYPSALAKKKNAHVVCVSIQKNAQVKLSVCVRRKKCTEKKMHTKKCTQKNAHKKNAQVKLSVCVRTKKCTHKNAHKKMHKLSVCVGICTCDSLASEMQKCPSVLPYVYVNINE